MSSLTTSLFYFVLLTCCGMYVVCRAAERDKKDSSSSLSKTDEILRSMSDLNSSNNASVSNPTNIFKYNAYTESHPKDGAAGNDSVRANLTLSTFLEMYVSNSSIRNKEKQAENKTQFPNQDPEKDLLSKFFTYRTKMLSDSVNTSNISGAEPKDERIEIILKTSGGSGKYESSLDHLSARKEGGRQFQFVFHPYLPYGKDLTPDEKISIHDVLPVKMVKFIKSMVEEAPWEAMFMKMVRMVVDQFVDKIIEKMFAHSDDEHDKWRSVDGLLTPTLSLSPGHTTVERLRRSADKSFSKTNGNQKGNDVVPESKMYETIAESDDRAWLDLFLDYMFPGEDKSDGYSKDKADFKPREKRNTVVSWPAETSESPKLSKSEFSELMNNIDVPLKLQRAFKDFLRYRILKRILRPLGSWRDITDTKRIDLNAYPAYSTNNQRLKTPPYRTFMPLSHSHMNSGPNFLNLMRQKRSLKSSRDEREFQRLWQSRFKKRSSSFEEGGETKRLWQSSNEIKPANYKRDDCSLRRACNAGRLLARLPSVQDITLQLRSHHHEPHWDALLWGMKKKKCSKIFCSRQRSPKGSRKSWNASEKRQRTFSAPRKSKSEFFQDDSTTVIPI